MLPIPHRSEYDPEVNVVVQGTIREYHPVRYWP
jgi:hypothetical protein